MEGDLSSYLLNNFTKMPKDLVFYVLGKLSTKDVLNLCSVNKDLHDFCQKYNVLVTEAKKYVEQRAPLSEPLDNIFKQANAIKRGQSTYYTLGWSRNNGGFNIPEVYMGDLPHGSWKFTKYFTIRGSPPPTDTEVYIFGVQSTADYDVDANPRVIAYRSLEDLKKDETDDMGLRDAIDEGFIAETYEEAIALLVDRQWNELNEEEIDLTNPVYNWFIYKILLP